MDDDTNAFDVRQPRDRTPQLSGADDQGGAPVQDVVPLSQKRFRGEHDRLPDQEVFRFLERRASHADDGARKLAPLGVATVPVLQVAHGRVGVAEQLPGQLVARVRPFDLAAGARVDGFGLG
ncbi:hypothetical protein [Streptomyces sp. AC1-42T]|uniref:hypothetical protein n=1 Tax=unclassified Streptomyces TaxID=2593676 RepID=UPI00406BFB89